jgi:hypothetical protein
VIAAANVAADTAADTNLRIAFWRVDFGARGPGDALAQISAERPHTTAMAQVIARLKPDILVLSGVDYDMGNATLGSMRALIGAQGHELRHIFAPVPNAGVPSGMDLNGDGIIHGPDDAYGYGEFAGARALAVLSRYPFDLDTLRDFTRFPWRDLPNAKLYTGATAKALAQHRLPSKAQVELPVAISDQTVLRLLIYHAGPPVFGFHPDRNQNRNHDETALWVQLLDGQLPYPPPKRPFVLIGGSNLDPFDGDGIHTAMRDLLDHTALQDPQPSSLGGAAQRDPAHLGPPQLDTVNWDEPQGNLRVSYVLPSVDVVVTGAGVWWPLPSDDDAQLLSQTQTRHKPVWVDLSFN